MSRTVRLSLALLFALMMVIATASAALAFNPPDNAPDEQGANFLCDPPSFPSFGIGVGVDSDDNALPGGLGPWNASIASPSGSEGPIPFPGDPKTGGDCG